MNKELMTEVSGELLKDVQRLGGDESHLGELLRRPDVRLNIAKHILAVETPEQFCKRFNALLSKAEFLSVDKGVDAALFMDDRGSVLSAMREYLSGSMAAHPDPRKVRDAVKANKRFRPCTILEMLRLEEELHTRKSREVRMLVCLRPILGSKGDELFPVFAGSWDSRSFHLVPAEDFVQHAPVDARRYPVVEK